MPARQRPSERHFGLVFGLLIGGAALIRALTHGPGLASGVLSVLAAACLITAWRAPGRLAAINEAWFRLGLLLNRIVSPLTLGIIYFLLLTPVGVLGRWMRRDELRLRPRDTQTYWMDREPPGPEPDSFKHQY